MREPTRGVSVAQVEQTLAHLDRVARAHSAPDSNPTALASSRTSLLLDLETLLEKQRRIRLFVQAGTLSFEGRTVLRERAAAESLPRLLHRNGVQHLEFARGLRQDELDALLHALGQSFAFSSPAQNLIDALRRQSLKHVRWFTIDTDTEGQTEPEFTLPTEFVPTTHLERLVQALSVNADNHDLINEAANSLAESLEEGPPGFHPARTLLERPTYEEAIRLEITAETPNRIGARAANAIIRALHGDLDEADKDALTERFLNMFDGAVVSRDLQLATRIVAGMNTLPADDPRLKSWKAEVLSDLRMRQLTRDFEVERDLTALRQFVKTCGPAACETLIGLLPRFSAAMARRALSDLVLEHGLEDLSPIAKMLQNEQLFVVREGLYILHALNTPAAKEIEAQLEQSPRFEVRISALRAQLEQHPEDALGRAERLLRDEDHRVQAVAAQALSQIGSREAAQAIHHYIRKTNLENLPSEVARDIFRAYGQLAQSLSLDTMASYVKRGEGLLTRRSTEDTAIAAMDGIMLVRVQASIVILKQAATARSKRVREAARTRLEAMRESKR